MSPKRAWVDVLTPKQVLFFAPLVRKLESEGYDVLVTSRKYREVGPLAELAGLDMRYVGERGDKGPEAQLVAATERQAAMIPLVKSFSPGVALSTASAVCARVAFGLRIRHVAVNDSPHSEVAGRLSLPLSYHLLCPWVIPYSAWEKYGMTRRQVTTYHALDPVVWLRRKTSQGPVPDLEKDRQTITIRLPESDAPYLAGSDATFADLALDSIAAAFPDMNLVALARYGHQLAQAKARHGSRYIIPDQVVSGEALLRKTDLFVGMGGTMSAEAALMGVPAISAFQGTYHVESYLMSKELLVKAVTPRSIVSHARRALRPRFRSAYRSRAKHILESMEDPVPKIARVVMKAAEQA